MLLTLSIKENILLCYELALHEPISEGILGLTGVGVAVPKMVSIGIPVPARVGVAVNIIYTFYADKFLE